jgi:hypothetical protein
MARVGLRAGERNNKQCAFVLPNVLSLAVSDVQHNLKEHVCSKCNITYNSS